MATSEQDELLEFHDDDLKSKYAEGDKRWRDDFGTMETIAGWISGIAERIVPKRSRDLLPRIKTRRLLSNELATRGLTEHAKTLESGQRIRIAGNMIDWVNARWTAFLGGIGSEQMERDPGALVDTDAAPDWLCDFTRIWTRKKERDPIKRSRQTWSFGRR